VSRNLFQVLGGAKSFGIRDLFTDVTFAVNEGEHIGVIGPNGAGKTTLFKAIAGELELDKGDVVSARGLRVGYLRQFDTWTDTQTVDEFLSEGTRKPLWELHRLGTGLGLHQALFEQRVTALSGGYRMRVKLLHLLGQEPDLMMLDEPTNYLDLETLLVLEEFLQSFEGAFLLISHDREFLRRTTDHILEIENGEVTKYSGHIDDYFEQKQMIREQLEKQAGSQQAKRQKVLEFAARFGAKASKARQAQSRLKQLSKMEVVELKPLPIMATIRIPEPISTGRVVMELKDVDLGYGDKVILQGVHLTMEAKKRFGVVGLNGAGKSTFLKSLAGVIPPLYGELTYGYQVSMSYFAQHVSDGLLPDETVIEAMAREAHSSVRPQEILNLAGALLFSGDDARKKVSVLSGGEKARVALGQILLKRSPVLLLDEPTNHLDFYTVEALTQALETYPGTVVVVSHDRGFIRRVATQILEVNHGKLRLYPGSYDDYVWSVQQRDPSDVIVPVEFKLRQGFQTSSPAPTPSAPVAPPPVVAPKLDRKKLDARKRELEKQMQDYDRKIKVLQSRMNESATQLERAQGAAAAQVSQELAAMQRKIEELELLFMQCLEEKEKITQGS
jgi:ATP-binding cassette subfamily F protein 3